MDAVNAVNAANDTMNNFKTNLNASYSSISGMVSPGGLFFLLLVIAILCYLFITQYKLQETQKKSLNMVETARKLQTIKEDARGQPLRNFYIKTALNCCSLGEWKNSYVDITALQYAIAQGYRCLDLKFTV